MKEGLRPAEEIPIYDQGGKRRGTFRMNKQEARSHAEIKKRWRIMQADEAEQAKLSLARELKKVPNKQLDAAKEAGQGREEAKNVQL